MSVLKFTSVIKKKRNGYSYSNERKKDTKQFRSKNKSIDDGNNNGERRKKSLKFLSRKKK